MFCEAQFPRLVGTLSLYCGDPDVAHELAQEAIARVCLNWPKVQAMPAPGAWTHRVALNLANSYFRRRAAERRAYRRLGTRSTPEFDLDTADVVAVRTAISGLPRRQRAAVILRYYADLPVAEIAEAMDCSDGTIKAQLHKAMRNLRRDFTFDQIGESHVV